MKTRVAENEPRGRRRRWLLAALASILALLLSACGGQEEPTTIRLAVLPILDALPMYVAQEQGYFEDENLVVDGDREAGYCAPQYASAGVSGSS